MSAGGGEEEPLIPTVLGVPESMWFKAAHLSPPFFFSFPPELQAFQARESRYLGDDSETSEESSKSPDDR